MLSFMFAGKDSYLDYGIVISRRPTLPSPKRRITYINIPGRDSSFRYDDGTYEDLTINLECSIKSNSNLTQKVDEIKDWLFNSGEDDLIFSFQSDKKYIAQVVNAIDFAQILKHSSKFPIIFNCRPFKYAVQNNEITILNNNTNINNPGTIGSLPIIKLYGTGDIILNIRDLQVELKDITGEIILNSEIQDCYDVNITNLNNKMKGYFPTFKPGQNLVSWSGNVQSITIVPNWRWL
ncbi:MAG: phage tail protein [Firmicutes bacterium]|nr:phage tail protein [Bacillota bacterium]